MNEKTIIKKNYFSQIINSTKENIKSIIIFLSAIFLIFISYQFFNFYTLNKIHNNSIKFFNSQNFDNLNSLDATFLELSNEKNFYGILSKLELIKINLNVNEYENVKVLYNDLLENNNLDNVYKSAIATKAAFEFIDINFTDLSKNYIKIIENFISFIDDELTNYKGIKLELNYLVNILDIEKNNLNYANNNEAIDLYNDIMNSDIASSIKERTNKIHEFFYYK